MKEISAYLTFAGDCRAAMEFYRDSLGGELFITTFGEAEMESPPGSEHLVMHARLTRGATVLMASDSMPGMTVQKGDNVWLSLACETDEEVQSAYDALMTGGTEVMAPHDAFWGSRFAMLTDRFGVNWMLNHERPRG